MSVVQNVSLSSPNYTANKCKTQSFTAQSANEQPKTDTQPSKDTFQMKKTHAGLITGGIISTVWLITGGLLAGFKNPKLLFNLIPALAGAGGDFLTNRKREKFNADVQELGADKVYKTNKHTEKTRSENLYLRDNSGIKVGAGIGALTGLVEGVMLARKACGLTKVGIPVLEVAVIGAVGAIQGAISDACANRAARKHAEKVGLKTL